MAPRNTDAEEAKLELTRKRRKGISSKDLLSTGSTLLNMACSGRANGGFVKGHYFYVVGDSASGKTFLTWTCLAEASINAAFDDYRFIMDDVEGGSLMSIEKFFGRKVVERVESPMKGGRSSQTIEDFYYNIDDALKDGRPFIYILDSMDALDSEDAEKKFMQQKNAKRKTKRKPTSGDGEASEEKVAGSYGDGKAKKNSQNIRRVVNRLKNTGSNLINISQTRDNIGFTARFEPKTRGGGKALKFYASHEIWSSIKMRLKRTVAGKPRKIGIVCRCDVKKNRLTGEEVTVEIPIYTSFGIDDVGSCVDYLILEKHWTERNKVIEAKEFEFSGKRESLIRHIEKNGLEKELRILVTDVWEEIKEGCAVKRKFRY